MAGRQAATPDDDSEKHEKKCKICNVMVDKRGLKCVTSKCNVSIHHKCFDQIASVFYIEKKNWRCRMCLESAKLSDPSASNSNSEMVVLQKEIACLTREKDLLNKLLSDMEYTVNLQKTMLNDIKHVSNIQTITADKDKQSTSYSEIVKTKTPNINKDIHPVILIKSKNKSITNYQIEKDVKGKINPGELNIGINKTKLIKEGLLISCDNDDSHKVLKETLNATVGEIYNISEPKKFNPRIIIYGVDKEAVEHIDLLSNLKTDNNLEISAGEMKLITKLKHKTGYNVVLELSPRLHSVLLKKGFLYVGWKKCYIKEHFSISRCYKCNKFGHHKKDCRCDITICTICSGNHEIKECRNTNKSCCNCINFNNKHKLNLPTDHSAADPECECYKYQIAQIKSRTNYVF